MLAASDPWTAILTFLQTIIVPNWGELITMLPFFVLIGIVGPLLSLVMIMWFWDALHRKRGHIRLAELHAQPAQLDSSGGPIFPPNIPFCDAHALLFPGSRTTCEVDGGELTVVCPIDRTVRPASEQICRACGTRYVLGASRTAVAIRRSGSPPDGGAAVA